MEGSRRTKSRADGIEARDVNEEARKSNDICNKRSLQILTSAIDDFPLVYDSCSLYWEQKRSLNEFSDV